MLSPQPHEDPNDPLVGPDLQVKQELACMATKFDASCSGRALPHWGWTDADIGSRIQNHFKPIRSQFDQDVSHDGSIHAVSWRWIGSSQSNCFVVWQETWYIVLNC